MTQNRKEKAMTDTNFNFNTAGEQRTFDVIPAGTICTLQMIIRPGGAGEGNDKGWLKRSVDGNSLGLDCEFNVPDGEFKGRKVWQLFTLSGTTPGHEQAGKISCSTLRAILESAKGIKSSDNSAAAEAARKVTSWGDFQNLRFVAKLGVRPAQNGYPAKNTIIEVITPDRQVWRTLEQINVTKSDTPAPAATPPANAIARPDWSK
jgi:hypothetical protein